MNKSFVGGTIAVFLYLLIAVALAFSVYEVHKTPQGTTKMPIENTTTTIEQMHVGDKAFILKDSVFLDSKSYAYLRARTNIDANIESKHIRLDLVMVERTEKGYSIGILPSQKFDLGTVYRLSDYVPVVDITILKD